MPLLLSAVVVVLAWAGALAFGWVSPVLLVLLTSAWGAWDGQRHRVRHYRSWLAHPTPVLFLLLVGAWILAFPSYLALRARIRAGTAEVQPGRTRDQARALLLTSPG